MLGTKKSEPRNQALPGEPKTTFLPDMDNDKAWKQVVESLPRLADDAEMNAALKPLRLEREVALAKAAVATEIEANTAPRPVTVKFITAQISQWAETDGSDAFTPKIEPFKATPGEILAAAQTALNLYLRQVDKIRDERQAVLATKWEPARSYLAARATGIAAGRENGRRQGNLVRGADDGSRRNRRLL